MISFKQFLRILRRAHSGTLDDLYIGADGSTECELLREGKWVPGRFPNSIRIDRATHMQSGDQHAHIFGRKGNLVGAIRTDGTRSHGCDPFRLSEEDANALRVRGFVIPDDNMIEWRALEDQPGQVLLLG